MTWLTRCSILLIATAAALSEAACAGEVSLEGKTCPCESGWVCCSDNVCARDLASCSGMAGSPGHGGDAAAGSGGDAAAGSGGDAAAGSGGDAAAGSGGDAAACPESTDFSAENPTTLALGPHNNVFGTQAIAPGPIVNYADQVVFSGPVLSLGATFRAASGSAVDLLPSSGTDLDPWLAEVSLIPEGCDPESLSGKTVSIRMLWKLAGTIVRVPPHGVYLGSYVNDEPVAYDDASFVYHGDGAGAGVGTRTLHTLEPIELTHTFTGDEDAAYLRMYLLEPDIELPTTVHVEGVTWVNAGGGSGTGGSGATDGTGGADGGRPSGGTGGSGMTGGAAGVCTRPQSEACPSTCEESNAACLQDADGVVPSENVSVSGTVTAVEREAWAWPFDCLGRRGPFGSTPEERVLVEIVDEEGQRWELSLPPDLIADDRFAIDDTLAIDFQRIMLNAFNVSRMLTVETDGELDAFFIDATSSSSFELDGAGVSFGAGELLCPYSVPNSSGCSSARHAVTVATEADEISQPCRTAIGGYTVTALSESAGQAPMSCNPVTGFCDMQSSFVASGVRER